MVICSCSLSGLFASRKSALTEIEQIDGFSLHITIKLGLPLILALERLMKSESDELALMTSTLLPSAEC
jgi:hypothetical protein